ncbi:MAG: hypothetical protein J7K53_12015, partial [Bacteroidales bacterium]|nr:hypothetical protein [Bacteroidales bacterium]
MIWNIGTRALKKSFLFACVVIPLMVIPNMYVSSLEDLGIHAVLISLREAVIFLIILGIITTKKISFDLNKKSIEILLYFFLIVVTVQAIGFTMGVVLFPPSQLLIENQDTLQGLHYAASLGLFHSIRTCAFYGEPSYLAFVTFSATFIILANPVYTLREKIKFLIIGSFIVIISRSLSGILAITILSSAFAWKQCSKKNVILFMLIIVILLLIVFFSTEFVDRVTPILSLDISNIDNSTAIRLIYPWNLIADTFQTYYLGGVSRDLIFKIYGTNIQGLDNGLFNLLINYGYLGVGVIL